MVIPTFLEAESIAAVVAALPRDIVDRVVVVDGGSPDGTAEVACRAGAEVITVGRGYGRACQTGAQAAEDADIIVFMDGDGADDPMALTGMATRFGGVNAYALARAREAQRGPTGSAISMIWR